MARLTINGKTHDVNVDPDTPLLWVIREQVGLTGTKYGCGVAQCGACTVHVDGEPMRSCSLPVSAVTPVSAFSASCMIADTSSTTVSVAGLFCSWFWSMGVSCCWPGF